MEHRLPRFGIGVHYQAKAPLVNAFFTGYPVCHGEQMSRNRLVFRSEVEAGRNMFPRDYKYMDGGLWIDIFESDGCFIFIKNSRSRLS